MDNFCQTDTMPNILFDSEPNSLVENLSVLIENKKVKGH